MVLVFQRVSAHRPLSAAANLLLTGDREISVGRMRIARLQRERPETPCYAPVIWLEPTSIFVNSRLLLMMGLQWIELTIRGIQIR